MQILYEMSEPVFLEKYEKYFNMLSEVFTQSVKHKEVLKSNPQI